MAVLQPNGLWPAGIQHGARRACSIVAALLLLLLPIGTRGRFRAVAADGWRRGCGKHATPESRRWRPRPRALLVQQTARRAAPRASELKGAIRHELRSSAATSEMVTL